MGENIPHLNGGLERGRDKDQKGIIEKRITTTLRGERSITQTWQTRNLERKKTLQPKNRKGRRKKQRARKKDAKRPKGKRDSGSDYSLVAVVARELSTFNPLPDKQP